MGIPRMLRVCLFLFICVFFLIDGTLSFHEDPYKLLGVKRTASESEIKQAYRKMALKYHPDKNPGNDQAEQQFMKIGQAYEQLTSAQYKQSNFYGHGQRRQQNSYQSRQQHRYYEYQFDPRDFNHYTTPNSFYSLGSILSYGLLFCYVMSIFQTWLKTKDKNPDDKHHKPTSPKNQQNEKPLDFSSKPSPLNQIARVFAPSIYEFNPIFTKTRGRRTLIFFPDDKLLGSNVREQFSIIEKLATEFQRDPVNFSWVDRHHSYQQKWSEFFQTNRLEGSSRFVLSCTSNGSKIVTFPASNTLTVKDLRKWLVSLLNGELPQKAPVGASLPII